MIRPPEPRALERAYTRILVARARLLSLALSAHLTQRMGDGGLSHAEAVDALAQVRHAIASLAIPRKAIDRAASSVGRFANRVADRQGIPAPRRKDSTRRDGGAARALVVASLREAWVRENVSLIGDMQARWYGNVERVILDASAKGLSPSEIEKAVARESGKLGRHAQLIAQDQIGKLNSQVAKWRQTSAGIVAYRWSTSRDERVRPTHRHLEGTLHRWDDPPVSESNGERNHPGMAIRCRCTAMPAVEGSPLEGLGLT